MFSLFRWLKRPTIAKWSSAYMSSCAVTNVQSTCQKKEFAFGLLAKEFSVAGSATQITKQRALAFLARVALERSGGSANDVRKQLAAAWQWGHVFFNLPAENPFRIPKFPEDEHPRYVPSPEDFNAMHALIKGSDYAMLLTFLHTAARRGEIFRLAWADVDFHRGIIRLGTRKRSGGGMQYDWLPMTQMLAAALLAHKQESRTELVFPGPGGGQYKARSTMLKKLCVAANVKRFGFHSLRHLAASMMAEEGLPITYIQTMLRHQSPLTTARYLHRLGALKGESLDRVFCSPAQ
jgi:integrase